MDYFSDVTNYLRLAVDCLFLVWFVYATVWRGHSSFLEAPNMYRLFMVFLSFSCIQYAVYFISCTTIHCCLYCVVSVLGVCVPDEISQIGGATQETIDALLEYKFKLNKTGGYNGGSRDNNSGIDEGEFVAIGVEKDRSISAEDAMCCICLERYVDNDDLRELTCSHFFHKECADQWLKISASCPLCKFQIAD